MYNRKWTAQRKISFLTFFVEPFVFSKSNMGGSSCFVKSLSEEYEVSKNDHIKGYLNVVTKGAVFAREIK